MNDHELMLLEVAHRTWPPFSVSARTASTIGAIFFKSPLLKERSFGSNDIAFSLLSGTALLLPLLWKLAPQGKRWKFRVTRVGSEYPEMIWRSMDFAAVGNHQGEIQDTILISEVSQGCRRRRLINALR